MLFVPVIMFCACLVLGLFWKRSVPSLLITTFVIAVGLGMYLGNWSFLFPLASLWHNLIYIGATVMGYFIFFVPPAVLGAALGKILRHGFRKK
jgi:hypothetical protein